MPEPSHTFYVKHIQRVTFDAPVYCEPMWIRLHPRCDAGTNVRSARLNVSPRPTHVNLMTDLAGNVGWKVTFGDILVSLSLAVTSCVDRWPVGQPLSRRHDSTTWNYEGLDQDLMRYYLTAESSHDDLLELVEQTLDRSDVTPFSYLLCLAEETSRQYHWDMTLADRSLTTSSQPRWLAPRVLPLHGQSRTTSAAAAHRPTGGRPRTRAVEQFVQAARLANIPARWVRGYCAVDADEIESELAVWAECYLGDHGWIGFDPCRGLPIDARYIPVSAGRNLAALATVTGEHRGSSRAAEWSTQIILRQARPAGLTQSIGVNPAPAPTY